MELKNGFSKSSTFIAEDSKGISVCHPLQSNHTRVESMIVMTGMLVIVFFPIVMVMMK
jgi:hypothetical protein